MGYGNYSNIALELKDSEAGNRFIQDNTKITVAFNEGLCRFTLVTTIERDNKQPFVGTLNIVLEQK